MKAKQRVLSAILLAALLAGCGARELQPAPQLQEPVGIAPDTAKAYIGEIYNLVCFDSKVVPYVEELYFSADGVIAQVYCYPGMQVQAGDVLAELDLSQVQAQLTELEADLEYTKTTNDYANTLLQQEIQLLQSQLRQLQENGTSQQIALKENEIAQQEATLRQQQAMQEQELQEKQRQLEKMQAQMENNVLQAPFSGVIVSAEGLQKGNKVKADEAIAFLADESKLHLSGAYIKEGYLNTADRVYAHIGGAEYDVALRPMDQQEYLAAVLAGATVETQFDILGLEQSEAQVEAGQYAAICLITDYAKDALLVPTQAVLQDAQGSYVYVEENGTHTRRWVKVGITTDHLTQILEGLQEGEVVYVQ